MLSRRNFIKGVGSVSAAGLVSACGEQQKDLKVLLLQNSVPAQLVKQFTNKFSPKKLNFKSEAQLKNINKFLSQWQETSNNNSSSFFGEKIPPQSDLVTQGDYWLKEAIAQNLLQPLDLEKLSGWNNLPKLWQNIVKRDNQGNLTDKGSIWGAPYRWGTTMIAYRADKFDALGWYPSDWKDLWRPELRRRISIVDQPREVIGLTLKKLGHSFNTTDLSKIPNLKNELISLQEQIRYYSSTQYLEPLIVGDVWVAVGWSTDILSILPSYTKIKSVVPQSGTALWSDIWVKPKQKNENQNTDLSKEWIDFCWQKASGIQISLYSDAASPVLLNLNRDEIPIDIINNSAIFPSKTIIENSEFINNLSPEATQQYLNLWQDMRNITST